MNYRTLGRTGLQVSEVSLGFAFTEQPIPVLTMALDAGINLVDTAAGYGDSEVLLGGALKAVNRPIMVETKFGGRPEPFNAKDKAALRRSFEESLKNLHRDHVDIMMIHEPDRPGQYDWYDSYETFTGPVTELLQELKSEGLVKYIGLGGTTVYEMARVMDTGRFDVVLTAFNYSLLWREVEQAVIPVAQKHDIALICASPLQQGWLVRRWDDEVNNGARWMAPARRRQFKALYALLDEIGMPIHELGLRFCLSNPAFSTVMTGAATVGQLRMNLDALSKGPLPKDILKRCDEISQMCYFRPWEEPMSAQFTNPGYAGTGAAR